LESRARNAALSRSRKNREAGAGSTHSTRNGGFEVSLSGILPLCSNSVKPACSVASAVQRPTRGADSAGRMACKSEDGCNTRNGKLEAEGEHPRLPAGMPWQRPALTAGPPRLLWGRRACPNEHRRTTATFEALAINHHRQPLQNRSSAPQIKYRMMGRRKGCYTNRR
jgi:hypothetical protein